MALLKAREGARGGAAARGAAAPARRTEAGRRRDAARGARRALRMVHDHRRRTGRLRGGLAGRLPRRATWSCTRCARSAPTAGPQDGPAGRTRLQQLVPRRQAGQRRRSAEGGDAAARLARHARGRRDARAGRRRPGGRSRALQRGASPRAIASHPRITVVREEVAADPVAGADVARDRRHGAAHLRRAVSQDIARLRRQRAPLLLRRHQPHRPGRDDRPRRRCSAPRAGTAACRRAAWPTPAPAEPPADARALRPVASTTGRATT